MGHTCMGRPIFSRGRFNNKIKLTRKNISGPTGVRGRNSDNKLIQEKLGWAPNYPLMSGLTETFNWINKQVNG